MTGRQKSMLVAGILAVVLFALAWVLPVPYVILSPGPTQDTLGRLSGTNHELISIRGTKTYPTSGRLIMLTVLLTGGPGNQPNLVNAVRAWANHEDTVVPQQFEFPPGQSSREVQQQSLQQMGQSQQDAITAALGELHLPARIEVQSVSAGTPAAKVLRAGDVIEELNGQPVSEVMPLLHAIRSVRAGDSVRLTVLRQGRTEHVEVATTSVGGQTVVGFVPIALPRPPLSISIDLKDVGGPSAGMMFALGVIDKLSPAQLTAGRSVAGTGTINFLGQVGPIGGIQQKVFAAVRAGATVFLAPTGECPQAARVAPGGLRVIPVATLSAAVSDLHALSAGGSVPHC